MHITEKDTVSDDKAAKELGVAKGSHLLTSTLEADGPYELATDKGTLSAKVLSCTRTAGGGIVLKTAITVTEPQPEKPKVPGVAGKPAAWGKPAAKLPPASGRSVPAWGKA